MATDPPVSVIIPTFNRAHLIGQAIGSVLDQNYPSLEIIVVDDGSTDETEAVVSRFKQVRLLRQKNAGPSSARNRGICFSTGEIIMFLDSDDCWMPSKVRRQIDLLNTAGPNVPCCVANAVLHEPKGRDRLSFNVAELHPGLTQGIWTNPAEVLATRFLLFNQVAAVRRGPLLRTGGFEESLRLLEDWDLALRLSFEGPWAFTTEPLALWNPDSNESLVTMARRNRVALRETALRVQQRALQRAVSPWGSGEKIRRELRRKIAGTQRELKALRLCHSSSAWKRMEGLGLGVVERCRRAVSKRMPNFPRMDVLPFEASSQPSAALWREVESQNFFTDRG